MVPSMDLIAWGLAQRTGYFLTALCDASGATEHNDFIHVYFPDRYLGGIEEMPVVRGTRDENQALPSAQEARASSPTIVLLSYAVISASFS